MFVDRGSAERRLASVNLTPDPAPHHQRQDAAEPPRSAPPAQTHFTINAIQRSGPRPLTRSLGVGEGNVHDTSLQIHEKELRTVILGGGGSSTLGKRNVGVSVRVATRSVGVSYSCDDARPATRSVGVNVSVDTSNVLTALDFKGEEELRLALRGVLQRSVHSVGTHCNFRAPVADAAVQHEAGAGGWGGLVSVGSGGEDCRVDVDVRRPVTQRSLGVSARPETASRAVSTDRDWTLDCGTNTVAAETYNKACSTDSKRVGTVSTNTEQVARRGFASQVRLFLGGWGECVAS